MNLEKILNYFELDFSSLESHLSLVITALILISLIRRLVKWIAIGRHKPPGPTGLPIVGYLPFLGKEPHKKFWNLREKYGNIIGVNMGPIYTVVLNDYSAMKEVLCHPHSLDRAPGIFDGLGAEGILTANGERWVEQRKYVMTTARDLGLGKGQWEDLIMEEIQIFTEKLKEFNGRPTDISHLLCSSLISSIITLLTSQRLRDPKNIEICNEYAHLAFTFSNPSSATSIIPGLRKFYEFFGICGWDRNLRAVRNFAEFWKEELIRHKTECAEYRRENDFISTYLEKLSEMTPSEIEKHYFSEDELRGHLTALFLGASDTIFSSLIWLIRLMCRHQDIQDKVYKELKEVLGKDGRARYEERNKVPYTFAVIMEGQRFGSSVRFSPNRSASQDIHVRGYIIPKGTELTANIWAIHQDPSYWKDPEVFRPERFLSADGTEFVKPSANFVPFSIGRRSCPGEIIAQREMLFYFSEIVKNFEISSPPGVELNFETLSGLVAKLVPQELCFKYRKN